MEKRYLPTPTSTSATVLRKAERWRPESRWSSSWWRVAQPGQTLWRRRREGCTGRPTGEMKGWQVARRKKNTAKNGLVSRSVILNLCFSCKEYTLKLPLPQGQNSHQGPSGQGEEGVPALGSPTAFRRIGPRD